VRSAVQGLVVACRYLTSVPMGQAAASGDLGGAAGWFPVVGVLIGAALAAAIVGLGHLVPAPMAALLTVGLWAVLTGGLHLDGLADALDGLGGGFTRDEALAIMRDTRIGAYGATGLMLVLGLKVVALASLPPHLAWSAALVAPAEARLAPVVLARLCPPVRPEGAGRAFALSVTPVGLVVAGLVATAIAVGVLGVMGLPLVVTAVAGAAAFAAYLRRRLGGLTGDCLGALVEASEAAALSVVLGLHHVGRL
jgi:adenosylcobinamide-GDP ribazoletransferase